MKVIGVGLPRTGTWSLKLALEQLGFGPCYHMSEALQDPPSWPLWAKVGRGEKVEWSEIFGRWGSTTDAPGCSYYQQLAAYYPDAKLILTERDPHKWFASTQATILNPDNHKSLGTRFGNSDGPHPGMVIEASGWSPVDPANHDEARMLARFKAHNAEVKAAFGPERLLVYEVAQGWEPLCRFLGCAVPAQPFPRVNSTEDFLQMVAKRDGGPLKQP